MNCYKCKAGIDVESDFLMCFDCNEKYHLACLAGVTKPDFDFIKTSGSTWKCAVCLKKKVCRDDSTPIKIIEKTLSLTTSTNESENDSETGGVIKKKTCSTCKKGFSFNSLRAVCVCCQCEFHFKCCKEIITKEEYLKLKSSWKCPRCKQDSSGMSEPDKAAAGSGSVTLADILSEMIAFRKEVQQTHKDFSESIEKLSDWINENTKKIDEVTKCLNGVLEKIDVLQQENINLKKTVNELNMKLNVLAQSAKMNEVEISGVPYADKEDLINVLDKISTAIGFTFNDNMIDKCYRYKRAGGAVATARPGGIVVRFVRNIDLKNFMNKRKEKRNLNSRDLGFMAGEAMPVYINCCLIPEKRKLLNAARQVKKDKLFTYLWVKDGRIFMRKNQGDRYSVIDSMDDLEKLA